MGKILVLHNQSIRYLFCLEEKMFVKYKTHARGEEPMIEIIFIITYVFGIIYYYPRTLKNDLYSSHTEETLLLPIWFIWIPIKFIKEKIEKIQIRRLLEGSDNSKLTPGKGKK